jgi:TP901 family phage tail tape measure protein
MAGKNFPISLIIKAVNQATAPIRQVSAQLGDLSKQVSSVGKTLTAGVTLPLAGLAVGAVAAFGRFEAGMANVSTLVDTSVESMDAMSASVLAVSRRTPVVLNDLTNALAIARGGGIAAADAMQVLEKSAQLGVAGLGSTTDALSLVMGGLNAWKLQGEEAANVYNIIFQAAAAGTANIAQLSQGFGSVAGTMASAGIKMDEYLAAVAAMTSTTRPASQAHTQMAAAMAGLTRQTDLTRAVFKKLGAKDITDLIQKSGGVVPAFSRIKDALGGNQTKLLELVGSTEALAAILDLTGNQAELFAKILGDMRTSTKDAVGEAFEKQNRTAAATMQRLKNSAEGVAISVGRVLVPVLQQLAPVLERAATWWEALGEGGQKSIIVMAGAAAAIGPAITVIGHLSTAMHAANVAFVFVGGWAKYLWMMRASIMAGLVPSLTAATASVWGFTVALLANPITWVVAAVVALGAAAYLIYKNWEPIKAFFLETWETIKGAVADGLAWVGQNLGWTPLGMVVNNWEPIKAYFVNLWDTIVRVFQGAWEKMKPIVDLAKTAFAYSPLGIAAEGGRGLFGGGEERPSLGAAQVAPGAGVLAPSPTETRVVVDFSNLPRGVRVAEAPGGTAPLDLSLGYGMMGG